MGGIVPLATTTALAGEASVEKRDTIGQYGVTWTFDGSVPAGQFVTGDWWVVGPVTVRRVTPAPAVDRHGSVVNPPAGGAQGYDSRIAGFDASLRAEFPLQLKPGESLVSTASVDTIGARTPETLRGQYCRGPLRTAVVLTCLEEIPPADAFRPAYVGTERFTASQLKRDILPRLKAPTAVPDAATYERYLERIWLDHMREWVNRKMHPLENMPDCGREITNIVSDVALLLLLDDPRRERETLLLRFVQKGIDYYGVTQSDNDLWVANGAFPHLTRSRQAQASSGLDDPFASAVRPRVKQPALTLNACPACPACSRPAANRGIRLRSFSPHAVGSRQNGQRQMSSYPSDGTVVPDHCPV
jgi:hypothetical protein